MNLYPHFIIHGAVGSLIWGLCLYPFSSFLPIWAVLGAGFIQGISLDVFKKWRPLWHLVPPWWTYPAGYEHSIYDLWLHSHTDKDGKWWSTCWHIELGIWYICTMGLILLFRIW